METSLSQGVGKNSGRLGHGLHDGFANDPGAASRRFLVESPRVARLDTKDPVASLGAGHALSVLEDIDKHRALHQSVPVLAFLISGTMGVFAFFLTLDLTKWFGFDVNELWMQISIPYALSILVWIFSFLLILSALYSLGFRDLRSFAKKRLSILNLTLGELDQLCRDLEVRDFKHREILDEVIADMKKDNARA